jgi:hypothetical protein
VAQRAVMAVLQAFDTQRDLGGAVLHDLELTTGCLYKEPDIPWRQQRREKDR